MDNLFVKLKAYVKGIPENVTYSVLPVLKWQYSTGEYRSFSISDSNKIIRGVSLEILAEKILGNISEAFSDYNIKGGNLDLYLMGRPWLGVDEFNIDRKDLEFEFNQALEKII